MICVLPAVVYSRKDSSTRVQNLGQNNSYANTYINEGNAKKIFLKKRSDLRNIRIKHTTTARRINGGLDALSKLDKLSLPNFLPLAYHVHPSYSLTQTDRDYYNIVRTEDGQSGFIRRNGG